LPVVSLAGRHPVQHLRETLAGPPGFFQCAGPRTLHLHDLGAMDEAPAGEADQLGLLLAPPCQRVRPLAGAAQLVGLLATLDRRAIEQAGDDRRELAGAHRHHDLVQELEPRLDPALLRQDATLIEHGERDQICVAEAFADLDGCDGRGDGRLVIARLLLLHHGRHQQVATFDAVALLPLEEPMGAPEPSGRARRLAAYSAERANPERAAHGAPRLAGVEVHLMRTLEKAQVLVVAAEQDCRRCEQLEVRRSQRRGLIREHERLVRLTPGPPSVGLTTAREAVGRFGHGSTLCPETAPSAAERELSRGAAARPGPGRDRAARPG
jgi:hypothetical protein